jgi:hypothetical protein
MNQFSRGFQYRTEGTGGGGTNTRDLLLITSARARVPLPPDQPGTQVNEDPQYNIDIYGKRTHANKLSRHLLSLEASR